MKYFYLAFFLICSTISHAQLPGFPLIDHTSEWHTRGGFAYSTSECNNPDTVMNNKTYLKMYYERIDSNYCIGNTAITWVNTSGGFRRYIREENNQIFVYDEDINDEALVYDYNTIEIGDSLGSNCMVSSIDTLYLLHQPYLKYICDCNYDFLIQGIGTKRFLFTNISCGMGIEGDWRNMCYSKNGFTIEIDTSANCISTGDTTLYVSTSDIVPTTAYRLFPNPTSNTINVVFDEAVMIDNYSLYSIEGRKLLLTDSINSTEFAIDISDLANGLYILNIELNNGEIIKEKILKTEKI